MPIAGQNNISTIFTYLLANHVYAVPRATAECILSSMVTYLVLLVITIHMSCCFVCPQTWIAFIVLGDLTRKILLVRNV